MADRPLRIGGVEPFSTVDFPGHLATVVFCQGCPLACGYCHNPDLIPATATRMLDFDTVAAAVEARRGFIDGVVFSGGEPLAQAALSGAVDRVREMGLSVALHTAGTAPALLESLLPRLDWVGFDVKAPFEAYGPVTGVAPAGAKARRALEMLAASGVPYEVRTTAWPDRIDAAALRSIAFALKQVGAPRFVLQECRAPDRKAWPGQSALDDTALLAELDAQFDTFEVRRAQH